MSQKKLHRGSFLIFFQEAENFNQTFARLMYVHYETFLIISYFDKVMPC